MIELTGKIQNDLSSNVSNLQYLIAIGSGDETIYISTNKQMFGTEAAVFGYDIINPSIPPPEDSDNPVNWNWNESWNAGHQGNPESSAGEEVGTLEIDSDTCYKSVEGLENGKTYTVTIDVKQGQSLSGHSSWDIFKFYLGSYNASLQDQSSEELVLGFNSFKILVNDTAQNLIGFIEGQGAIINSIYIREEDLDYTAPVTRYYEDLDLKVSKIKEKIDLKTKKIQLSNISITLSNLITENGRLSDRLINPLGDNIDLYIKTQSCETIYDCNRVAKLKITRYNHDNTSIRINADDISLETFYLDLPTADNVLIKDENTFEKYDLKPIPILYGELESAPAIPYIEEMSESYYQNNGISICFDTSVKTGIGDVEGVRHFNLYTPTYDEYQDQLGATSFDKTNLENSNSLQVKVGENIYSVNCLPYMNASDDILDYHNYPQYQTEHDRIVLVSRHFNDNTILSKNALWVHDLSKSLSREAVGFWIYGWEVNDEAHPIKVMYQRHYTSTYYEYNYIDDIRTMEHIGYVNPSGDIWMHSIGGERFTFNPIGDTKVYSILQQDGEEFIYPTDLTLVGNLSIYLNSNDNSQNDVRHHHIFGYPSGWKLETTNSLSWNADPSDAEFTAADVQIDMGFPPEVGGHFSSVGWAQDVIIQSRFGSSYNYHWIMQGLENNEEMWSHRSYFNTSLHGGGALGVSNMFKALWRSNFLDFSALDSTELSIYHVPDPEGNSAKEAREDINTYWTNLGMRRHWAESDIFNNDFFVNAKGRLGNTYTNVNKITGQIRIWDEGRNEQDIIDMYQGDVSSGYENKHFNELYRILSDKDLKTKLIEGQIYDLILINDLADGSEQKIIYDITINNLNESISLSSPVSSFIQFNEENISHGKGWITDITAKSYGGANYEVDGLFIVSGVRLAYAKLSFENDTLTNILLEEDSPELLAFNETNGFDNTITHDDYGAVGGRTNIYYSSEDVEEGRELTRNPASIIKNLLNVEMDFTDLEPEKYQKAFESNKGARLDFSVNKVQNSKDLIEKICSQSRLMFRYRPRDGKAILDTLKDTYSVEDVDFTIKTDSLLSYKFSKSRIEDLCIGGCRVKYGYDYAKKTFGKTTEDAAIEGEVIFETEYGDNLFPELDTLEWQGGTISDGSLLLDWATCTSNLSDAVGELEVGETYKLKIQTNTNTDNMQVFLNNLSGWVSEEIPNELGANWYEFTITVDAALAYGTSTGSALIGFYNGIGSWIVNIELYKQIAVGYSTNVLQDYKNYYGIEDDENYQLEFSAPYIQDTPTAIKFRDYLFKQYKNQHLIVNFSMDFKDAMKLEVGDIVNFDKDIGGVKPYGKGIADSHTIINQEAYPYFLITSITKNIQKSDIVCYQLHNLE